MPSFKQLAGKLLAISDDIFDRASMGYLDAYTGPDGVTSPAQVGFRAIDDQGNAIFDSLGLIAVMKSLGRTHVSPVTTSGSAYADVPGTPVIFSLKRQSNVLVITSFYGKTTGATGQWSFLQLRCGTHSQVADWGDAPCNFDKLNAGFCNASTFFNVTLPAGSYDAALQAGSDAGQSCLIQVAFVEVFLLGS
jgi:hypothetical protein